MLYMVIEKFVDGDSSRVAERFKKCGRMLPEGLGVLSSWMQRDGTACFLVMEAEDPAIFEVWKARWEDLIEFKIAPVMTSAEFWAGTKRAVDRDE